MDKWKEYIYKTEVLKEIGAAGKEENKRIRE
jgi:hypothetical protein